LWRKSLREKMNKTYQKPAAARGVTYEQVAAAADALLATNQKLSVRNVREALGDTGSLATISRHLTAFDAQRPKTHAAQIELSPGIRREIEAEIQRHVTEATSTLHEQLANVVSDRDAVVAESETQSAALTEAEQQLAVLRVTTSEQAARIEELRTVEERERTAAEHARVSLAEANLRLAGVPALQVELERLRGSLDTRTAELSAATATAAGLTAERDGLQKQLEAAEQRGVGVARQTEQLQAEVKEERNRTATAETRAASAEGRVEATAARVADLQSQLKEAAAREADATRRVDAAEQRAREAAQQPVQQDVRGHK
jgi:colicin import membrane protein